MSVFKGSRYEGAEYTGVRGADGVVRRFLHQREPLSQEDVGDVIVRPVQVRQELDEIAERAAVGKALLWWLIADVNDVMFPLELTPGTDLLIPIQELENRVEP